MTEQATTATGPLQHLRFPGEDAAYRVARNSLLEAEVALRRQVERVSAQRRAPPPGGLVREDYVFEGLGADGAPKPTQLSELFLPGQNSIALYSFMYGPERARPCPGCTHWLDSLDGAMRHSAQRLGVFIVAKSPLQDWDMPMLNVFRRDGNAVRHFWGSEMLYVPPDEGQDYRHNDMLDPLWNLFDVTPEGRGKFQPKLQY